MDMFIPIFRDSPDESIRFELYAESKYADILPKQIGAIEIPLYIFSHKDRLPFDIQLPFVTDSLAAHQMAAKNSKE